MLSQCFECDAGTFCQLTADANIQPVLVQTFVAAVQIKPIIIAVEVYEYLVQGLPEIGARDDLVTAQWPLELQFVAQV
jgi:hypothetical protein